VLSHTTKDENDTTEAQGTRRRRRTLCGLGVLARNSISRKDAKIAKKRAVRGFDIIRFRVFLWLLFAALASWRETYFQGNHPCAIARHEG